MSGRGRGVSNEPAWMVKQRAENGGGPGPGGPGGPEGGPPPHPPRRSHSRSRSRERDGGGGGGGDRDPFGRVRSGGGPPPPRDGGGRYGGPPGGGYGGYGPPPGFRGGGGGGGGGGRGRSPPGYRGGGRRGGRSPPGGGGGNRTGIYFRSFEEERAWVEDRRRRRRERKSQFDVEPTPEQLEMEKAQEAAKAAMAAAGGGAAAAGGGGLGATFGPGDAGGAPRRPRLPASSQPQQTRHARRIYVGHLPPDLTEEQVHSFFREAIAKAMGHDDARAIDDPILSVYVNPERRFAFIEFKTMEICTACMGLDGINVLGRGKVKVKRPNDYNPALAPEPNPASLPKFDISRLGIVSGSVPDGPNKLFIGGLPYHLTEENCLELLGAFGAVRAFHLVKSDPTATTNKGYGFVEYVDPAVTPVAIMGLNGMDMGGGKQLSARMAASRADPAAAAAAPVLPPGAAGMVQQQPGLAAYGPGAVPAAAVPAAPAAGGPVDGVDVEALLNAAMGGAVAPPPATAAAAAPLPPAVAPAAYPAAAALTAPAVNQIADAALDAAFGGSAGGAAAAAVVPLAMPTMPPGAGAAAAIPYPGQQQPPAAAAPAPPPPPPGQAQQAKTRILVLLNMVEDEDLATDEDFAALSDEVREECAKFGRLLSMKVPRLQDGYASTAVKKIFLEYATIDDAVNAEGELAGRQFGPSVVEATYFSETDYAGGKLY